MILPIVMATNVKAVQLPYPASTLVSSSYLAVFPDDVYFTS